MGKRGVIIVAGGSGKRMQSAIPKQFMLLGGMPVVARTINTFSEALPGAEIVVVLPEEHLAMWTNLAARLDVAVHKCVAGGKERFHSVKAGIDALSDNVTSIAVHDGVRALISKKLIIRATLAVEDNEAVIPVINVVDSYRRVTADGSEIVPRSELRIVQTPQIFKSETLRRAYEQEFDASFTDDASVVEAAGHSITLTKGSPNNIKITHSIDLLIAEEILKNE